MRRKIVALRCQIPPRTARATRSRARGGCSMALNPASPLPVSARNTSSSVPPRSHTDPGRSASARTLLAQLVAVVGVEEPAVGELLDAWRDRRSSSAGGVRVLAAARTPRRPRGRVRARRASRGETFDEDPSLVHDHEPVAELRRFLHVVRREQQRHAAPLEGAQPLPHEVARLRVEAGRRLVQDAGSRARSAVPRAISSRRFIPPESRGSPSRVSRSAARTRAAPRALARRALRT